MNNDDDIQGVLLDLLKLGLLRIRALGSAGDAESCGVEADHIHNLPMLIRSFSWERLLYYYNIERTGFASRTTCNLDEFRSLWDKLDKMIQSQSNSNR